MEATTANPLPASPARAAPIVASGASKSIWLATLRIGGAMPFMAWAAVVSFSVVLLPTATAWVKAFSVGRRATWPCCSISPRWRPPTARRWT